MQHRQHSIWMHRDLLSRDETTNARERLHLGRFDRGAYAGGFRAAAALAVLEIVVIEITAGTFGWAPARTTQGDFLAHDAVG